MRSCSINAASECRFTSLAGAECAEGEGARISPSSLVLSMSAASDDNLASIGWAL